MVKANHPDRQAHRQRGLKASVSPSTRTNQRSNNGNPDPGQPTPGRHNCGIRNQGNRCKPHNGHPRQANPLSQPTHPGRASRAPKASNKHSAPHQVDEKVCGPYCHRQGIARANRKAPISQYGPLSFFRQRMIRRAHSPVLASLRSRKQDEWYSCRP